MKTSQKLTVGAGLALVIAGILMAAAYREPHFYAPFSVGLALLGWAILQWLRIKMFSGWGWPQYVTFFAGLLAFAFLADWLGMKLDYWIYPNYHTIFDWTIQKLFEFVVPMLSLFFILKIGLELWAKHTARTLALAASLVTFILPLAVATQYLGSLAHSWVVLKMPLTSASLGPFSVIFTTVGYWILASVPYTIYHAVNLVSSEDK